MQQLDAAKTLGFLGAPAGNRLEASKGDLAGRYSIRVNDQWRVLLIWSKTGQQNVEIVDCH